jgi:hypothetical protein
VRRTIDAVALLALCGCGGGGGGETSFGSASSDPTIVSTSGSATDTSGATEETEDPTEEEASDPGSSTGSGSGSDTDSDTEDPSTTSGLEVVPCVGVDVLFVVDNSVGMAVEQTQLSATANAFLDMLVPMVPSAMGDFNIGVITTDDAQLVVPAEAPYSSMLNWMTYATLQTAPSELATALAVGEAGHPNERPMDMLVEALTGDVAQDDGFNSGFVREDALLVVVLLTDEEDDLEQPTEYGSAGDPGDWIEGVAAVKGGILRDVVPLAIIPSAGGECTPDGEAPRLQAFVDGFPRGVVGDVCAADYSGFLLGQIASVAEACTYFSPP